MRNPKLFLSAVASIAASIVGLAPTASMGSNRASMSSAPAIEAVKSTSRQAQAPAPSQAVAVQRAIADLGGGYITPIRSGGRTPYEWGISRECAKMVRKNRMRSAGIAAARI